MREWMMLMQPSKNSSSANFDSGHLRQITSNRFDSLTGALYVYITFGYVLMMMVPLVLADRNFSARSQQEGG